MLCLWCVSYVVVCVSDLLYHWCLVVHGFPLCGFMCWLSVLCLCCLCVCVFVCVFEVCVCVSVCVGMFLLCVHV